MGNLTDNLTHNLALGIIIELQDLDLLEKYRFFNKQGYAKTHDGIPLHRMVHSRMTGRPLSEYTFADVVRHKDPNGLDCRRSNLFMKTGQTANQSDLNRSLNCNSTSGIHGVTWDKCDKKWKVQLCYRDKDIFLGRYDTLEQAARVAAAARVTRAGVTCSDAVMDHGEMKRLLKDQAKKIKEGTTNV